MDELPKVEGYQVVGVLGSGAMGIVYHARELATEREVALKFVNVAAFGDERGFNRFREEARILARVRHPHVVTIYGLGEAGGVPYCSMEYLSGGNLAARVSSGPMEPLEAARLVECLARTLGDIHRVNILHGDLKPANILLSVDGTPKVADFGLARRLDPLGVNSSGNTYGTFAYMAPEQLIRGAVKQVDHRADIWALGVILFELCAGSHPFQDGQNNLVSMLTRVVAGEPRLPQSIPSDLRTIGMMCLRNRRSERYGSASELAMDLRRFIAVEPLQYARKVGLAERLWKWVRREPVVAAYATAAMMSLLGGICASTYFAVQSGRQRHRAEARSELLGQLVNQAVVFVERGNSGAPLLRKGERAFLEGVAKLYEQLINETAPEPRQKIELARAHRQIGDILRILNRTSEAERAYREALFLYEQLPPGLDRDREHATALRNFGALLRLSRPSQAEVLLRRALDERRALVKRSTNPELDRDLADGLEALGGMLEHMKRLADAEPVYREGLFVLQRLVEDAPNEVESRLDLANAYSRAGEKLRAINRRPEAEQAFHLALKALEPLEHSSSSYAEIRWQLIYSHMGWGEELLNLGRIEEADKAFSRAQQLAKELGAEYPENLSYHNILLTNRWNLRAVAMLYHARANADQTRPEYDREKVERDYDRALGLLEEALRISPEQPDLRFDVAQSLRTRGQYLRTWKRKRDAERALRDAVSHLETLAVEHPEIPDYVDTMMNVTVELIAVYDQDDKSIESVVLLDNVKERLIKMIAAFPAGATARKCLADCYYYQAREFKNRDDHRALSRLADEMTERLPQDAQVTFMSARTLSLSIQIMNRDETLSELNRRDIAISLGHRAVSRLREALSLAKQFGENGYDHEELRENGDLKPLGSLPEFTQFLAELDSGGKRNPRGYRFEAPLISSVK